MSRPKKSYPCKYPACPNPGTHGHHVTYRPRCVFRLCPAHHREITTCNINAAEAVRRRLTNRHRWFIWTRWLAGELQPVDTPTARRWMKNWRD